MFLFIYFAEFSVQEHILVLSFWALLLFLETTAVTAKYGWPSITIPQLQMKLDFKIQSRLKRLTSSPCLLVNAHMPNLHNFPPSHARGKGNLETVMLSLYCCWQKAQKKKKYNTPLLKIKLPNKGLKAYKARSILGAHFFSLNKSCLLFS